jgi:transposase-like protein
VPRDRSGSFEPLLIPKCYVRRSLGSATPLRPSFI